MNKVLLVVVLLAVWTLFVFLAPAAVLIMFNAIFTGFSVGWKIAEISEKYGK